MNSVTVNVAEGRQPFEEKLPPLLPEKEQEIEMVADAILQRIWENTTAADKAA